jgi:hypothetical protein
LEEEDREAEAIPAIFEGFASRYNRFVYFHSVVVSVPGVAYNGFVRHSCRLSDGPLTGASADKTLVTFYHIICNFYHRGTSYI